MEMSKQNLFLVIKLIHAYTAPVKIWAFVSDSAKLLIENKSDSCCPLNQEKKNVPSQTSAMFSSESLFVCMWKLSFWPMYITPN